MRQSVNNPQPSKKAGVMAATSLTDTDAASSSATPPTSEDRTESSETLREAIRRKESVKSNALFPLTSSGRISSVHNLPLLNNWTPFFRAVTVRRLNAKTDSSAISKPSRYCMAVAFEIAVLSPTLAIAMSISSIPRI
jgi:hypothetical protein